MGQLIRFKGNVDALGVEEAEAEAATEGPAAGAVADELRSWRALTEGRFVALRFQTDAKNMIRCAEVLSVDRRDSDNEVEVWYYWTDVSRRTTTLGCHCTTTGWCRGGMGRLMEWCILHQTGSRLRAASFSSAS